MLRFNSCPALAIIAALAAIAGALCPRNCSAQLTLTGLSEFSVNSVGNYSGNQAWDTNAQYVLWTINSSDAVNGPFVNGPTSTNAGINIPLSNGTHTISFFGQPGIDTGLFGLHMYFNGSTTPGISVFAPTLEPGASALPAYVPNGGLSTPSLTGTSSHNLTPAANAVTYRGGGTVVGINSYYWANPAVYNLNRVSAYNTNPTGTGADFIGSITYTVGTFDFNTYQYTWNGFGADNNWSTSQNWTNNIAPENGYTANVLFTGSPPQQLPVVNADWYVYTVTYDNTTAPWILTVADYSYSSRLHASKMVVGDRSTGSFLQTGGTNTTYDLFIGNNTGSSGTYTLSGVSSTLDAEVEYIGYMGAGTLNQTSGANNSTVVIGETISSTGTYNLSGGSLTAGTLIVADAGTATFNQNGGTTSFSKLAIAQIPGATGTYNLSGGSASDQALGNDLTVGGGEDFLHDHVAGGKGVLTVSGTGVLTESQTLIIFNTPDTRVNLEGGTINTGALDTSGNPALFNWTSGTLGITGPSGLTFGSSGPLGKNFMLNFEQTLNVTNTLTVSSGSSLAVSGGNLSTGSLVNAGNLIFSYGSFSVSNGLANQAGGAFVIGAENLATINGASSNAGEIQLGGFLATIAGTGTLTNTGLVRGDGIVSKPVTNAAGGEIRMENGQRMKFTGASGANAGMITLQGGTAEFSQSLTNSPTGQILGRGTLITGGTGLLNQGNMQFSAGITDVFGKVTNNTGTASKGISIAGNANVTFWNDVTNTSGLFKVNAGSTATFFGNFSGNGISGNASDNHFESGVSPGFSPAKVTFGGNVSLGAAASLNIELAGTTQGSQYDSVQVTGQLSLDGILNVMLLNGFTPAAGNSFAILDWPDPSSLSGTFSSIVLPTLTSGLAWNISQLYTTGVLSVAAAGLSGDFNSDGKVNAADYVIWRKTNRPASDYTIWRMHFGENTSGGSGSGAAFNSPALVPEPNYLPVLLNALMLITIIRMRRGEAVAI